MNRTQSDKQAIKERQRSYLVVREGVPSRMPEGLRADLSPGTVFLLHEMFTSSRINSP